MSGWLPWNWGASSNDAAKNLEPDLQEFLDRRQPNSYKNTSSDHGGLSYRDQLIQKGQSGRSEQSSDGNAAGVPSQAVFKDGRYKDLWASYKPLEQLEEASKSENNKLMDIVEGYRERQASIGRAATENCVMQELALHECYRRGTWGQIMKMCRDENRALDRCVSLQSRFLRALGYADVYVRSSEQSERIQMHADQLYNRMLDYERLTHEAKAKGTEPPPFEPLFNSPRSRPDAESTASAVPIMPKAGSVSWDKLEEEKKVRIEATKFADLTEHEKELTKAELDTQYATIEEVNKRINENLWSEYQQRKQRQESGLERPQDKLRRWFDFKKYPDAPMSTAQELGKTRSESPDV